MIGAEQRRLDEDAKRVANWKRWGPYLAERQWGTVREDYSADGHAWEYFPHDHARSRAYRWGEDGLLGFCDRECRLCFALALWNGKDPILKERLFGLTGTQGNHGEDVKEAYFYLDATPTFSYTKSLYKYPQAAFPYDLLIAENARRGRSEPEYELADTGVFAEGRYFDVTAEYAKNSPDDTLIRLTIANRGPETSTIHLLPTLFLRNVWVWGCTHEGCGPKGSIISDTSNSTTPKLRAENDTLGSFCLTTEATGDRPQILFTDNETNCERLYGEKNPSPYVKDGFHRAVVDSDSSAIHSDGPGTKAAFHFVFEIPAGEEIVVRLRLQPTAPGDSNDDLFGQAFDAIFAARIAEADAFYEAIGVDTHIGGGEANDQNAKRVTRQAYAGLLQSRQFYHYSVADWLDGDPNQPVPPPERLSGRNSDFRHLFTRDILSMPDKWEYPWFANWDSAFQMTVMARVDPVFAKEQMLLLLREWYMHPNGQIPAYEWAFGDVNPPTHAGAVWQIYLATGREDKVFLKRAFQKLLLDFTWWVNRKDADGRNVFGGGFLGMDNVGLFDRSRKLAPGERLDQADGTAWMAFYCLRMLAISFELAIDDPIYEDMASKFFEHYVSIVAAISDPNDGLWDEQDGFYYDRFQLADGRRLPIRLRSCVGLVPLMGVAAVEQSVLERLPAFAKRMKWFIANRPQLGELTSYRKSDENGGGKWLLAIASREKLVRVLTYMLDEDEFLSPFGIRSLSRHYADQPYVQAGVSNDLASATAVHYTPGESDSGMFGGNSNWRGPIWFPINMLLIHALENYHNFYGDDLKVECPTRSGNFLTLLEVARELSRRLAAIFLPDDSGRVPWQGDEPLWKSDPHWKDLDLFFEHFHGDTGRGLGASHQTGWTAMIALIMENYHPSK